ncbi:MAG: hypothetical protein IJD38_11230 [Clostridia bacterium]|nr:hypothetical protein [Clostridia bacterium]
MPKSPVPFEGAVTPAEALRFKAIADEIMLSPKYRVGKHTSPENSPHIGTLAEKRLHAAVKLYLCPDETCHERPVGDLLIDSADGMDQPTKKRRMVADILVDGHITEVQTGGFFPLRPKIEWYLTHTSCRVTVVHPISAVKYLSWINPEDGSIISRHKSPKRGRVRDVAKELYWLSDFIGNPRLSVRLLLLEIEEYRLADGWSKDKKRGSNRYERFPTALLGDVTLWTSADYAAYFLPAALSSPDAEGGYPLFTAAAYAKATGIRGKATYSTIHLLERLGLVEQTEEKVGRSRGYRVIRGADA